MVRPMLDHVLQAAAAADSSHVLVNQVVAVHTSSCPPSGMMIGGKEACVVVSWIAGPSNDLIADGRICCFVVVYVCLLVAGKLNQLCELSLFCHSLYIHSHSPRHPLLHAFSHTLSNLLTHPCLPLLIHPLAHPLTHPFTLTIILLYRPWWP